jgi:WD40-like Beta Propeller Repeat
VLARPNRTVEMASLQLRTSTYLSGSDQRSLLTRTFAPRTRRTTFSSSVCLTAVLLAAAWTAAPAGAQDVQSCSGRGPAERNGPLIVDRGGSTSFTRTTPLYTVGPDGHGLRRLTTQRHGYSDGPLFSVAAAPDGRSVSYVRSGPNSVTIRIASLQKRRSRTLTIAARPLPFAPATWTANGRWIAFSSNDFSTWIVRPDGTDAHRLPVTNGSFNARYYSPNGRCLVGFAVGGPGVRSDVAIIPAAGGAMTLVPTVMDRFGAVTVEAMRFTPNGRRIAFLAGRKSNVAAYSVKLDGSGMRKLTPTRGLGDPPVFSPDGRLVAYPDKRGTMVRKASGGPAHRLLKGSWIKTWAPRAR